MDSSGKRYRFTLSLAEGGPGDSVFAWHATKLAYGEVDNPSWTSQNGSKLGPCALQGCGSDDVFEP